MHVDATPAHAAAMAGMHALAFAAAEAWDEAAFAAQLAMPGVFGLIDARGGLILARVAADEAEVLTLAVAPAARYGGVGAGLLAAAMTQAGARGARRMLLEVAAANAVALRLYARAGFGAVGRRRGYYADGGDALILAASLGCATQSG